MPYTRQQNKTNRFSFFLFKCVTRPNLSGVPLRTPQKINEEMSLVMKHQLHKCRIIPSCTIPLLFPIQTAELNNGKC